MTSREIVRRTLDFERPERVPRDLWTLPIANKTYPGSVEAIHEDFPNDFGGPEYNPPGAGWTAGNGYALGTFVDEWGCVFENIQEGVIGEVKEPLVARWSDLNKVKPPDELLGKGMESVNESCAKSDKYLLGGCCPRPWERMQFIRGSQNLYIDVMDQPKEFFTLRDMVHEYFVKEYEIWARTDVDGLIFMDDWGTQHALQIPPPIWRSLFKPLYKDYADIAHSHGKKIFMHSDGHIFEIYEDLIEIGIDAVNSQLFCMDIEEIGRRFKGRITFWGEIDRQHVLPSPDVEVARRAVRRVAASLYDPSGGVIAQCEFGPAGRPENVRAIFEEWEKVGDEK